MNTLTYEYTEITLYIICTHVPIHTIVPLFVSWVYIEHNKHCHCQANNSSTVSL